jgi:hypothetical protein
MPRRVVPIEKRPRRTSAALSSITWYGMIRCALPLTRSVSSETPRSSSWSISFTSAPGSTTVPLPITHTVPG